jgi:hypothetical protein
MRPWMILSCLLLVPPPSVLACDGYTAEATQTLSTPNRASATWGAEAEEATMAGAWLAAAGSAALVLVVVAFRAFCRASGLGPVRPVEFEPSAPEVPSAPAGRPVEAGIRVDPGHERPGPNRVGRHEEALSYVLEMR